MEKESKSVKGSYRLCIPSGQEIEERIMKLNVAQGSAKCGMRHRFKRLKTSGMGGEGGEFD